MSDGTKIQWADASWNPITGCTKVSQGCKNCYAAELHDQRHKAYLNGAKLPEQYAKPFETVQLHPERLEMPLHWRKPRRIFVNSTSDLFHPDVPDEFIDEVFLGMGKYNWYPSWRYRNWHTFLILTKRPERMKEYIDRSLRSNAKWGDLCAISRPYLDNVWLGVTVENAYHLDRIDLLRRTHAAVRFISFEPLLGPVDNVDLTGIHWVIVGGESGPNARPMQIEWARSLRDQCTRAGVKFFFKQWGEWYPSPYQGKNPMAGQYEFDEATNMIRVGKRDTGRLLDGREWDEYPEVNNG